MKYGVLDSLDKIQKFENTYSQICFANLSDITPYQCFSWVYNYAKYFIGQNVPHIIYTENTIIPMWVKRYNSISALEFIGTRGTDYLNLITNSPKEAVQLLLNDFIRNKDINLIYLEDIIETAPIIEYLMAGSVNLGLYIKSEINCPVRSMALPDTPKKYISKLSDRMQKDFYYDIRYAQRHLKNALEFSVENTLSALQEHIRLHQKLRNSKGNSGSYYKKQIVNFMTDFIMFLPPESRRICFIKSNGQSIASILSIVLDNRVYLITVGYDPEFSKYDVGKILFIKDICNCIEHGYVHYDLSRGAEEYKDKLGCNKLNNLRIYISKTDNIDEFQESYNEVKAGVGYNPDF